MLPWQGVGSLCDRSINDMLTIDPDGLRLPNEDRITGFSFLPFHAPCSLSVSVTPTDDTATTPFRDPYSEMPSVVVHDPMEAPPGRMEDNEDQLTGFFSSIPYSLFLICFNQFNRRHGHDASS